MNRVMQCVFLMLVSGVTCAHHSSVGYYDRESFIEIEGTIGAVHWRNPHVKFALDVTDITGAVTEWEVELAALSMFRSRGFGDPFLHTGESIKVYGNPAINGSPEMGGTHLLLSDGKEVIVSLRGTQHFTDPNTAISLAATYDPEQERLAREQADDIYRVWSTVLSDPSFPMFKGGYPITPAAAQVQAQWDPLAPERFECWQKGMPYLMITPHPFEFVRDGDDILMRFEEDDAVRRIHMAIEDANPPQEYFHLGYSVGKWDGETLVVETTNISAPNFDDDGTPQSNNVRLVERFDLSADESRLDYRITIVDPETFTRPFDLTRFWVWVPGRLVDEWQCET